jgi:hypothetical protein
MQRVYPVDIHGLAARGIWPLAADVTQRRRGGQADTSSWSRPPPSMFTDAPWSTVYDIDEAALHEALDS